jgi:Secretion system C-terminal sorting domain
MTRSFTALFSAKNLALSLFFSLPMVATAQVLFSQDFSAGGTAATYTGSGGNLFDFIGVNSTGGSSVYISAVGNRLQLQRNTNAVSFARTTNLATPAPAVLKVKFRFTSDFLTAHMSGNAAVASVYVGQGLLSSASGDCFTTVDCNPRHSVLGIAFPAAGKYCLRSGSTNSTYQYNIDSEVDVFWYINNSGNTINYTDPSGNSATLDNDVADVWVKGVGANLPAIAERIFTAIPAINGANELTNIKCIFNAGSGNSAIAFDDFEISTGTNVIIPVTLSSFTAKKAGTANQLTWVTESEINNKGYDLERQTANGKWETLGFVKGLGKPSTYHFEDKTPLSISYYRLRQVDFDGKETLSKVVSVTQTQKGQVRISPNPTSGKVNIVISNNDQLVPTTMTVYDLIGKQVLTQKTTTNVVELDMSNLAKGTYLLKIDTNNSTYTEKIMHQ